MTTTVCCMWVYSPTVSPEIDMPARTKGRAKFNFRGRQFVWWIDGDRWLRIASLDKKFVVAFALGRAADQPPILTVSGQEFPGLEGSRSRPRYVIVPEPSGNSMGAWVDQLLRWSFDATRQVIEAGEPPRFM
jgi:hypothetical protein